MPTILWNVTASQYEAIGHLATQLRNYEISPEEYREALAMMDGYPLPRLLESGDDLKIVLRRKARSFLRPVPGPTGGLSIYRNYIPKGGTSLAALLSWLRGLVEPRSASPNPQLPAPKSHRQLARERAETRSPRQHRPGRRTAIEMALGGPMDPNFLYRITYRPARLGGKPGWEEVGPVHGYEKGMFLVRKPKPARSPE